MFNDIMAKGGRLNQWIVDRLAELDRKPQDLVSALDVEQPRVSEIISGKRRIHIEEIEAFARCLDISVAQAVRGFIEHRLVDAPPLPTPRKDDILRLAVVSVLDAQRLRGKEHPPEMIADAVIAFCRYVELNGTGTAQSDLRAIAYASLLDAVDPPLSSTQG